MLLLHLTPFLPTGDHRQAGGTPVNVRKPHKVQFSWHGTFNSPIQVLCIKYSMIIRVL